MFDRLKITDGMKIVGAHGKILGTVERVDGDHMKLVGSEAPGHSHLALENVDRVEGDTVYLKMPASEAEKKID